MRHIHHLGALSESSYISHWGPAVGPVLWSSSSIIDTPPRSLRSTESLVNKLIIFAVHRGLLTSIGAGVQMILVSHGYITCPISRPDIVPVSCLPRYIVVLHWACSKQQAWVVCDLLLACPNGGCLQCIWIASWQRNRIYIRMPCHC
jgi:hypothetical protein